MKARLFLFAACCIAAILIIGSCRKSNHDTPNPGDNTITVTANLTGRITDANNLPVSGAFVKAGSSTTTTDINGNFLFSSISLGKNAGFVSVEKEGYFLGSRTIMVHAGSTNYVAIQLIKKTVAGTISGSSGGTITVPNGGSINFGGNSFINADNNRAYTGTVSVSTYFIDPTASNFNNMMPGALRGINTGNEETALQSFGMMAVELTGTAEEKLQLAPGKTATITFPIPTALQAQAPASIALWSFNDTTGLWKREGTATKQGASYVGIVSHFSFWNCDQPFTAVDFSVTLKDQTGAPITSAQVVLKTAGDTMSVGSGYTDNGGFTSGKIPAGKTFVMTVYSQCQTVLYTAQVGPFTTTADLGTITINNAGTSLLSIAGTVLNCNRAAVANGFVDIALDNNHYRASLMNGFSINIQRCSSAPATAIITAYDLDANQNAVTTVPVTTGAVNLGQISACGTTIPEFYNFTVSGNGSSYVPTADSLTMYSTGTNQYTIWASRKYLTGNYRDQSYLMFTATGIGTVPVNYFSISSGQSIYLLQSAANVNITEWGAAGSGYVSGNLTTSVKDTISGTTNIPVTLTFRVKRY